MQFSYSRVELFKQCPCRFKYSYIDELKAISELDYNDALILGSSLHLGLETDVNNMLDTYHKSYNIIDNNQVNESIKLEILVDKVKKILNTADIYAQEYLIDEPEFKGIVDLIIKNEDGTVDVFDFKYSNNVERYMESGQLHIYKYFLEKKGFKVNRLGFIFIPKTAIRQKKTENLYQFRKRLVDTVNDMRIRIIRIEYNPEKVKEFFSNCRKIENCNDYPKVESKLCDWCEFKNYCKEGQDYMILPKNEKRDITKDKTIKAWIYGVPFIGKSYLANEFPDAIFLNTDGNVKFIDSPFIAIKDDIEVNGRIKNKIFAWDTFEEAVDEIITGNHDFKTIVVDLLDDVYEASRLKVYDKFGIEHEADAGYGKGYDLVRTEFLPIIRKLTNSKYNVVLISHEVTSDFIKRNGEKISTVSTPLPTKVANKIAGMVDFVGRLVEESGERYLSFKASNNVFGGGRLEVNADKIKANYEEIQKLYDELSDPAASKKTKKTKEKETKKVDEKSNEPKEETAAAESKRPRKRRTKKEEE